MDTESYTYDDRIKPITRIEFGILGNEEVRNMSALGKDTIGIQFPELYDVLEPKRGGLIDPRLGTTDISVDCQTCGYNSSYCPGHFGHIELAEPVFHIAFLPYVKKILGCICINCSKLLIHKNEKEIEHILETKTGKNRLNEIRKLVKNIKHCQKVNYGCGAPVVKIKIEKKKSTGAISLIIESMDKAKDNEEGDGDIKRKKEPLTLTPDMTYDILKNISDRDCVIMGFDPKLSRPEDMIIKIFPVPPVQVRPSAKVETMSGTLEDDLTHVLANIIKANLRVRKYKEIINDNTAKYFLDHIHFLQLHCATYIDNESLQLQKSEQKGTASKTLTARLSGKEGHFRSNLMGKRTDFSARTVIGSDPSVEINEVRLPVNIAKSVTFPEVVTKYNIEHMKKLVRNGASEYPGANCVFPISSLMSGRRVLAIDLRYRKEGTELRYGDIVERHLLDGDIVLFNRQPTLHKVSMMGHKVKIINNPLVNSFGMSVYACKPYNADFDGDEMNIFIPQSIQTQIELEEIADVKKQIINPSTSMTIIGVAEDGLLGSYNLTDPTVRVNWKSAMNIISYTGADLFNNMHKDIKKNEDIDGQKLFSLIIPSKVNLVEKDIKIENGNVISGRIRKDVLGAGKHNAIHRIIIDEYGPDETIQFLNNHQRLINNYNLYNGFSVGIDDVSISK